MRENRLSEEYDLKKSEQVVGQLRPIIKDVHGKIVDGIHREKANIKWKVEVWDSVKTEEDYWKTRAHLNFTRRNAQETRAEKLEIINSLAEFYVKQGLRVSDGKPYKGRGEGGGPRNEVLDAVVKALDGAMLEGYIRKNIDSKYTQDQKKTPLDPNRKLYKGTPEEAIHGQFGEQRKERAYKIIEDLKKKAREEALEDPKFVAKAASKIVEMPIETIVETTLEKPEPLTSKQVKDIKEAYQETQEKIQGMRARPEIQERAKWFKMWSAMGNILAVLDVIFCPICGEPASTHLIFKCHPENKMEQINELVREKLE